MRFRQRFSPPVGIAAAVLVASMALPLPKNGAILGLPSICAFHNFTGWPCPGCGLTRSFVCCGHGDLSQALVWHPLGPLLFAATVFYVVGSLLGWKLPSRWERPLAGTTLAVMVVFWFLRLDGVFPLPGG